MEVNIFSHIRVKFKNHYCSEVERVNKVIELGDTIIPKRTMYDTDELKRIDEIFEELNEEGFNFTKSFQPYYVHYIDLETIKKISTDLFFIEKKKNPYINIRVFKQKYFDNVKYYLEFLVEKKRWKKGETKTFHQLMGLFSSLQESVRNSCYCRNYTGELCNFYILDDFFTDIYVLKSYADAFFKFIEEFDIVEEEENKYITQKIETTKPQPNEVEIPNKTALTSCSVQVSMLNQMGVLDLPIFQNKSQAQKERILSKLLNRGIRDIRGNINSLNPNSNEDLTKYTAGSEGTQAKARDILNQL